MADGFCAKDCRFAQSADADFCSWLAPDCTPRELTADDISFLQVESSGGVPYALGADAMGVAFTLDEAAFLWAALGLLRQNTDLVSWAVCMVSGVADAIPAQQMLQKIWGLSPLQIVPVMPDGSAIYGAFAPYASTIAFNRNNLVFQGWLAMFNSSNIDERVCALIQLASMLVHEMTHLVHIDIGEYWGVVACDKAYMIGGTFQWVMFSRYPSAASCCATARSNDLFGCGENVADTAACPDAAPSDGANHGGLLERLWFWITSGDDEGGGGGGGGGPTSEFCMEICPQACAGGYGWALHTEADMFAECFGRVSKWISEKNELGTPSKMDGTRSDPSMP